MTLLVVGDKRRDLGLVEGESTKGTTKDEILC